MKKSKAFTLIELIVVLVILAIIALIATPIILNLIDKSQEKANEKSIDGYGKAIEFALSSYKLKNGKYTYDINNLDIKYTGSKVECDDIAINENGSIFISKCKVDGKYVEDKTTNDGYYQYGSEIYDYKVGDTVTYNNMDFIVINNSRKSDAYFTLIKAKPLVSKDVREIAKSTEVYNNLSISATDNDVFSMQYYYSDQCKSIGNMTDGCINDYNQSSVKQIVDVWANSNFNSNDLVMDNFGYKARLLTIEELTSNLGYKKEFTGGTSTAYKADDAITPNEIKQRCLTMSPVEDSDKKVWIPEYYLYESGPNSTYCVQPVINLRKSLVEE